jgi:hypothetical protein
MKEIETTFAERYRQEQLPLAARRLAQAKQAMLEAEALAAQRRREYEKAEIKYMRLASQQCPSLVCPSCYFERHVSAPVVPIPHQTEPVDLFKCMTCGDEWEEPEEIE